VDYLLTAERTEAKPLLQQLERNYLTLRTRLKRLMRKTICFSKKRVFSQWFNYALNFPLLFYRFDTASRRPTFIKTDLLAR